MLDSSSPTSRRSSIAVDINGSVSAHRFPAWMMLLVFSCVCLASLGDGSAISKWIMAVSSLSLIFSAIGVLGYLKFREAFVGKTPEMAVIFFLAIFWSAGLPSIMNPTNNIAIARTEDVTGGTVVYNANLYFFAWFAFGAVTVLAAGIVQETWGIGLRTTPTKAARWYGITAASLVVMCSAARSFKTSGCSDDDEETSTLTTIETALQQAVIGGGEFCRRNAFAVAVGVLGFIGAGVMTLLIQMTHLTLRAETFITAFQLIWWCFGVGYITFQPSPGATIGNLYFATWIAFAVSVMLFASSFRESVAHREALRNATVSHPMSSSDELDLKQSKTASSGESRFGDAEDDDI